MKVFYQKYVHHRTRFSLCWPLHNLLEGAPQRWGNNEEGFFGLYIKWFKSWFWLRLLCIKFLAFTCALCSHNGRSLQAKNLRSRLAKNQLLNHFRYRSWQKLGEGLFWAYVVDEADSSCFNGLVFRVFGIFFGHPIVSSSLFGKGSLLFAARDEHWDAEDSIGNPFCDVSFRTVFGRSPFRQTFR